MFSTITSVCFLVILASSMFYPIEPLPTWLRRASLANPVTWQVDFLRYCTLGTGAPHQIAWEVAAFTGFSLVAFYFAARALQQQ